MLRFARLLRASGGAPAAMTPRMALKRLALSPSTALTQNAIKKAYVKQTLLCHPDLYPDDPEATDKFRSLSDALRVALKALEVRQGLAKRDGQSTREGAEAEEGMYDSHAALEALRRAIVAYRVHRESSLTEQQAGSAPPGKETTGASPEDMTFFSPSLEYVSAVCRQEALAMRRVRAFCEELPAVLCGSSSAALFEAVAFFHARYVQSTSDCVMRFSKDLPVIVRRVVKARKRYVRNKHTRATTGFATGSRPREQRIEDMAMKPLVLVGALIFDVPEEVTQASVKAQALDKVQGAKDAPGADSGANEDEATSPGRGNGSVTSTCGVAHPSEITVSEELKCTIYPADSIATITEKLGRWEAESYNRLKLELAIVDACVFLSGMLGLSERPEAALRRGGEHESGDNALAMVPHLHVGKAQSEKVLLTLQALSAQMCDEFDDSLDFTQKRSHGASTSAAEKTNAAALPVEEKMDHILACLGDHALPERHLDYANMQARSQEDDRLAKEALSLPVLIAECRRLAVLAAPGLKGTITVSWGESADLVETASEMGNRTSELNKGPAAPSPGTEGANGHHANKPGFSVGRHGDCCTVEMVAFSASLELTKDLRAFLLRLRAALKTVVLEYEKAQGLVEEVRRIRDATVREEFIPCQRSPQAEAKEADKTPIATTAVEEGEEENQEFRYRGPIFNFARLYNAVTSRELVFWQLLHRHREYLAAHASAMNMLNVYLDCMPGQSGAVGGGDAPPDVVSGWVGESVDEDGTWDAVVLTAAELEDPANFSTGAAGSGGGGAGRFRQWLEEVVEQSSLNRECRATLDGAGIGYLRRDPTLPLTNYLSFIKVFAQAGAVRGVLERRQSPPHQETTSPSSSADGAPPRVVRSEDIGLTIIVGHRCDVRDGGRLLIPWSMDPNALIALLGDGADAKPAQLN